MKRPDDRIPLSQAAHLLGYKYFRTRDLFLCGILKGDRDERGRIMLDRASVEQLLAERPDQGKGAR